MKLEKLEPLYPFNKLCREMERGGFRLLREPPPFLNEESAPGDFVLYYFKNLTGVRALVAVRFRSPDETSGGYWSYYSNSVTVHWLKKMQTPEGTEFIPCGVSNRHAFPVDRYSHFVEQLTVRRPDTTEMENYNQYHQDVREAQRRQIERMRRLAEEQNRPLQPQTGLAADKVAQDAAYDSQRGYAPGIEAASVDDDIAADLEDMKKFVSRISKSK